MNAVGIDVSKGKKHCHHPKTRRCGSYAALRYPHTPSPLSTLLLSRSKALTAKPKVCMEHTGRYYEPVATWLSDAGIFVSAVNPILIRDFGDDSSVLPRPIRLILKKIARYALDRWAKLKQYGNMDKTRNQLKTMNRQFGFYMAQKTAMKNNLIALLTRLIRVPMISLTAQPAVTAARNGWISSIPTGMWIVSVLNP